MSKVEARETVFIKESDRVSKIERGRWRIQRKKSVWKKVKFICLVIQMIFCSYYVCVIFVPKIN